MSKKLNKVRKRLGERLHAHAATIKSLPNSANPAAYKAPGSMNPKKNRTR
jgi:hypothetical protein